MPQAEYVTFRDAERGQLMAVYASDLHPSELEATVNRLVKLRGVYARIEIGEFENGVKAPTIRMEIDLATPERQPTAIALLKRLANPKLPYTLLKSDFTLEVCPCGMASLEPQLGFLQGFSLESEVDFRGVLTEELVYQYLVTKDSEPIIDELWRLLQGLRIHASRIVLSYKAMPTCRHPPANRDREHP
jgi:hypothetical protein